MEGLSNYSPWKERIKLILQVNKIWELDDKEIKKPTNPKELEIWEDLDARARLIILDGVEKCATRNVKIEISKNNSLNNEHFGYLG